MAPGDTQPIAVTATFDDGTPAPAEAFKPMFVSSNPAAASVDDQGTVRATGIGGGAVRVSRGGRGADPPAAGHGPPPPPPPPPTPPPSPPQALPPPHRPRPP